jgi:hypothetical protein
MPQHLQKQVGYLFVTWTVSQYLGQMRSELQREEEERNLQKKLERERERERERMEREWRETEREDLLQTFHRNWCVDMDAS